MLRYLNLSNNRIGSFLNYILEFQLINSEIQTLIMDNCALTDEGIINVVSNNDG